MVTTLPELRDRTELWHPGFYDATQRVGDGYRLRRDDADDPGRGTTRGVPGRPRRRLVGAGRRAQRLHVHPCGAGRGVPGARPLGAHPVTSFLRTGRVGPAVLSMREVRRGRTIMTMVAELVQDDQILITSSLTL